ncbi:GNAT family N-acetyltransferase [Anaerobacillus alkaliphilus]|nr:GNAT family N-acetyltransferase [Anaerobacillus alkaliphilus]
MDVIIRKASLAEKEIVKNLMQYYFYDFSEFVEAHLEEDGRFGEYPNLDHYWIEQTKFPYLVEIDGRYAGFSLVRLIEEEEKGYYSIAEFFIMKKYRRFGIGKQVATEMFHLHRGNWEVFQLEKNQPAQHFWRNVIDKYTKGKYTERYENGRYTQVFSS